MNFSSRMRWVSVIFMVVVLSCTAHASTFENLFGATNIYGHVGNSSVAAGFSEQGEMTVFHWPSPSYFEHLCYLSSNVENARELPYLGAHPAMGSFAGMAVNEGKGWEVYWFRDEPFEAKMAYLTEDSNVLKVSYISLALGVEVTHTAFVHPDQDTLSQRFAFSVSPDKADAEYRFLFYENFSPSDKTIPMAPIRGWALDFFNDFAAIYDPDNGTLLHFLKSDTPLGELSSFMLSGQSEIQESALDYLDALFLEDPMGVYLSIGFGEKPDQVQVGMDATPVCEHVDDLIENAGWGEGYLPDIGWLINLLNICWVDWNSSAPYYFQWIHDPQDAFSDSQDGELSGSIAAASTVNATLGKDLQFDEKGEAIVDVFISSAGAPSQSAQLLATAQSEGYQAMLDETEDFWSTRLGHAWLPDSDEQRIVDFAKRTLITLFNGYDKYSGAIVASIAMQAPYYLDWPRDAAFLNHALDLAGFYDEVTKHNIFFASVQRKQPIKNGEIPAGTYEMNYYANGSTGGFIRFEIDNTGCITWSMWDHYTFLKESDPEKAMEYLIQVYPAIALAADNLAECKDDETGLQCYATEDDNPDELRQTMQGATAVYMALAAAVEAGRKIGESSDKIQAWEDRAAELKAAALEHLWNEAENRFDGPYSGQTWALWPAKIIEPESDEAQGQAQYIEEKLQDLLLWEKDSSSYDGKGFLALAYHFRATEDEDGLERLQGYLTEFLNHVPMQGTLHMGEVYEFVDLDEDGVKEAVQHKVSQPHIWEASLNFAASMVAFGMSPPELDDDDDDDNDNDNDDNNDDATEDDDADEDEGEGRNQSCCAD